jgi:hypothetical protein
MKKLSQYLLLLLLLLMSEISDYEALLSEIVLDVQVTQDVLVQDPRDQQVEILKVSIPL